MTDKMILTSLEQIVRTVKIALKTDAETARALVELNAYLIGCSAESRKVLKEILTDHGFHHVITPPDWEHTKKFCCQHKSGAFVLEYPDRLIAIVDGEIHIGEATSEKPYRVWYKEPCGGE